MSNQEFWQGRRVLLTGHTGFKGSWLCVLLNKLGAEVHGLALVPDTDPSMWQMVGRGIAHSQLGDIRDLAVLEQAVAECDPHVVIHMAAQALVRPSYQDPAGTMATNVMGTANVLEAVRLASNLVCLLVVTSDKVYRNDETRRAFSEGDELGGHDPYSASKACAELVVRSYRQSFFSDAFPIMTARSGNVIGGGDWAPDRVIPDVIRALSSGQPVALRNPDSVRPWQHVLDPLEGYLRAVEAAVEGKSAVPEAFNFGPDESAACSVAEVVEAISGKFAGRPGWKLDGGDHPQEAGYLTLSSKLARDRLNWRPRLNLSQSLDWTADWYRAHLEGADMLDFTRSQIDAYHSTTGNPA